MINLKKTLDKCLQNAFLNVIRSFSIEFNDLELRIDTQIVNASKPDFGDFQVNGALSLGKELKEAPRKIAQEVISHLTKDKTFIDICKPPEIAGPGFINLRIREKYLVKEIESHLKDARLGIPLVESAMGNKENNFKIVIDFSSPNIAKEMHVGHLRSTIIGDSLARVLEFRGYDVLRLNHVGDWGTQFGMLISYLKIAAPKALEEANAVNIGDLVTFYKQAKARFDEDISFQKQSREEVIKLQSGDPISVKGWELICNQSREEFQKIYNRLDIKLLERGESFYNCYLEGIINALKQKGLLEIDDGAKCVFLEKKKGKDGKPMPVIVQKSDGGFNYSTTDLAAIRYRLQESPNGDGAKRLIYVTDAGQANHFAGVFEIAERASWIPNEASVEHVPFGLVQGEDGKKLKTRSGDTVRLVDLLDKAIEHAEEDLRKRLVKESREETEEFITDVARIIGLAAVKYADLSQNRISNYRFSFEKMLALQGNTAPYLLYALVRISGISRKGGDLEQVQNNLQFKEPQELNLIRELLKLDEVIEEVEKELLPNRLCNYLFELSQVFNRFYDQIPILKAEGKYRSSRLALCKMTADTLKLGLNLLGIPTLERM